MTCLPAKTRQKKLLRDIGLKLADTLPGVKPQLLRQAMGLNDLPQWLR
ncbi:monooxygenase [Salmonella enterica subsp. enterica]|uniref:Monooxygenase n=1 Tax=Salmonella enterica I TaxID=59201 RepID=A0A447TVT6_SALET|nr:monooxygenase [Salmonella enterica subsp. enterica]